MGSIWTDLLSLHGYPVHRRETLAWRDDGTRPHDGTAAAGIAKAGADAAPATATPKRRLPPWPRLASPH